MSHLFIPQNPDFKNMVLDKMQGNHFVNHLGITLHTIEAGLIEGELPLQEAYLQQMGFVHGGVTSTMVDVVMGFAAYTLVKDGQGVVTVDLKVNFVNPGKGDKLRAIGKVYKAGQKLHFCEAEIFIGDILIARADSIMAVLNPEDFKR